MRVVKPQIFNPYEFSRPTPATYYNSSGIRVTAGVDELRLGYDPTTLEFIGPILEGATDNWILYSDDFTDANWTNSGGAGITPDAAISADGTMNATLWDGVGDVSQALSLSGAFVFSIDVKPISVAPYPSGISSIQLSLNAFGTAQATFFFYSDHVPTINFSPGTFIASFQVLPNGWYRIWVANESGALSSARFTSAGDDQFYLGKAQVETGLSPTSYIETSGTAGSRAADVVIEQSPSVIESNIEEDDAPVWDESTPYTIGQTVMVLGQYHRVYESTGSNTNKFPPDNPLDWIDTGATNRWRMFDMKVGADKQSIATEAFSEISSEASSESGGDIRVLLGVANPVDSITLLNVDASAVQIILRDEEGDIVYDYYVELLSAPDEQYWWGWFFGNRRRITTIVRVDLPPFMPVTIEVIAYGDSNPAKIGKLIIGDAVLIGCARYGTSVGIIDFSRKEEDPFGNFYILERRFIGRCNYDVQLDSDQVDNVHALLAEVRATPCVYVGSDKYKSTVVFGFYRDFDIVIPGPRKSACSLQVQGI